MASPNSAIAADHRATRPRSARLHLFEADGSFALDVDSGRIAPLSVAHAEALEAALLAGDTGRAELTALALGIASPPTEGPTDIPWNVPVKAISLAVAQKCNLGCVYCYAQQGSFGATANHMPLSVAKAAVDQLVRETHPGDSITLAFMGGEPLTNRATLHAATHYAAAQCAERDIRIGFSLTTNATLLRDTDASLFQEYPFTVTVSIDGGQTTHDRLRPFKSSRGSFQKVADGVSSLLSMSGRRYRVLARVTVTPENVDLSATLDDLLRMGFDGVVFSPMLSSPSGRSEMAATDLELLLEQMVRCGELFREHLGRGTVLPFQNIIKTLQRIHARERDAYPCGAGGGYLGVSAEGQLYACHRFVNDDEGHLGSVADGLDQLKRSQWLESRHLDRQSPCTTCWARHLCSGSCHYEAMKRGRPACDYIRGWLHYCLTTYVQIARRDPAALQLVLASA